jgi:NAD(P)H-hydrate epimerase
MAGGLGRLFMLGPCSLTSIDRFRTPPYYPAVQPIISAEGMRDIDRLTVQQTPITSLQLMQNAAEACFQEIKKSFSHRLEGKTALILCGPGNNGGDGAALAPKLSSAGMETRVVLFGRIEDTKGDARTNFEQLTASGSNEFRSLSFVECAGADHWQQLAESEGLPDLIVDAMFGTGLTRPLSGVFSAVVDYLNHIRSRRLDSTRAPVFVSVDIPSGLDADLPIPIGKAVQADVTVTFTAPKPVNVLAPASNLSGRLVVADIGSPVQLLQSSNPTLFLLERDDAKRWLVKTRYTPDSFKNRHGHVLVIAGSRGYAGAAVLCGNAAMRSGAGLVTIATAASAQPSVAATAMSEVMTVALPETEVGSIAEDAVKGVEQLASKTTVIAIGPGLSVDERTRQFVHSIVMQRKRPMVIDADGLNCLAPWPGDLNGSAEAPLILTPHPGEMLRLLGVEDKSSLEDRVSVAREFATRNNVILVLKGSRLLVAAEGRVFVNPTGNPGLGTAGSGDTLTGIIAGFIAQAIAISDNPEGTLDATLAAVYVGGLAGDIAARELGMRTMVASDIREHLSAAICELDPEGEQPSFSSR